MRLVEVFLDVAPHLVLVFALVLFFRRKLLKRYPFFFALISFQLLYFATALLIYLYAVSDPAHRSQLYKWVATSGLAIGSIFEFGVLYELSDILLLSRIKRWEGVRPLLRLTTAILVLVASLASALLSQANLSRVLSTFQTLNFSVNLFKLGFLLIMILLTRVLSISWKGLPAGIALGLSISAAADLGASALMSRFANLASGTVDMIRMAGFNVCVIVWITYILRRERPWGPPHDLPLSDVEVHLRELQRMTER
ncbi:MAG TPA: hypothetical protein VN682_16645 [Terriglobales bacterium]|jgi:hypothetical protein|nr:hypothetical protein [Terriglobales bacterium]